MPAARSPRRSRSRSWRWHRDSMPGRCSARPKFPTWGFYDPAKGALASLPPPNGAPHALVTFYRSYLTSADTGPVDALISALRERGFDAYGAFATSLKAPGVADWLKAHFAERPPAVIVNATAFSAMATTARRRSMTASCPVFQVALSTARREDWASSLRGLSPADLAMHVVLPEVDGRLHAGVVSFKSAGERDPRFAVRPSRASARSRAHRCGRGACVRVASARDDAAHDKQLAIVLSSYPGRPHQIAHAVGLDALASTEALLGDLGKAGFDVGPVELLAQELSKATLTWRVDEYRAALKHLPEILQDNLASAWGDARERSASSRR